MLEEKAAFGTKYNHLTIVVVVVVVVVVCVLVYTRTTGTNRLFGDGILLGERYSEFLQSRCGTIAENDEITGCCSILYPCYLYGILWIQQFRLSVGTAIQKGQGNRTTAAAASTTTTTTRRQYQFSIQPVGCWYSIGMDG